MREQIKELGKRTKDAVFEERKSILALVLKTLKYSKGGFSAKEKKDLGEDLLSLAMQLLEEALEEDNG